ncbi:hypothetical protein BU26DRAFT_519663 [Trematosphaeria pertusa]|uniref:BYS1 domain protein n=1 Tax=Trematosphaeria pertusa TaxID=390896 RepID=A0A6A6IC87_9PLEO|nr:uncharacterized protein BU26DRAFT_519663 [Trematosphaeria pertusa]KAF2247859.1 hypothetical protein BU26DRAFT_519663 [Trematosphaeria pertusa]
MLFVILFALLAPLLRAQELTIRNYCDYTVYAWHNGGDIASLGPVQPNQYTQAYLVPDPVTGGKDIVLSANPNGLYDGSPTLHFNYNKPGADLWYSMVNLNGAPFGGHSVSVMGQGCPNILWPAGVGQSGTLFCPAFQWLEMYLCQNLREAEAQTDGMVARAFEG